MSGPKYKPKGKNQDENLNNPTSNTGLFLGPHDHLPNERENDECFLWDIIIMVENMGFGINQLTLEFQLCHFLVGHSVTQVLGSLFIKWGSKQCLGHEIAMNSLSTECSVHHIASAP